MGQIDLQLKIYLTNLPLVQGAQNIISLLWTLAMHFTVQSP